VVPRAGIATAPVSTKALATNSRRFHGIGSFLAWAVRRIALLDLRHDTTPSGHPK
jgi:hypothetical protein